MEDTTGYHAEDRSSDQGSDLRKDDAWRALAPENRDSGPARDYGPQGLGDPGYGQWNYRLGNYDYGFAANYGRGQDNAYLDPAYFGEGEQDSLNAADVDTGAMRQARHLLKAWERPGPLTGRGRVATTGLRSVFSRT